MHAPLFNPAKKSTVVVPGFCEQRRETSRTETLSGEPQNPPVKQLRLVVPMQKVTPESRFPLLLIPFWSRIPGIVMIFLWVLRVRNLQKEISQDN